MILKRNLENEILQLLEYFPVVGIIGPRQVGKTTLAKQLVLKIPMDTLYLDLELSSDYAKLDEPELFLKQHEDKCIVIDEIQRLPSLFPLLRALIDQKRKPGRFLILGSASPELIRDSSESLAGRIAYKELKPFSFTELPDYISMEQHWINGGFPDSILTSDEIMSFTWRGNFVKTYIERDLPLLGLKVSPVTIEKLWRIIANQHGQIINYSNISKALGISVPTVRKYIDFLEKSFLITRLHPFFPNVKKRLVKSSKIFLNDSGILHYLLGIENLIDLHGNIIIGNSWEGYVIQQIVTGLKENIKTYFYRTHDQSEVDLVLIKGNKVISAIEIKYTSTPRLTKGNTIAINDLDSERNFIITPESDEYNIKENITVCSLRTFLSKYLPS